MQQQPQQQPARIDIVTPKGNTVAAASVQSAVDAICRDTNPEFCASVAHKPEYCGEHVIVNNKRVIEICPVTCKACDRILEMKQGGVIKKVVPQQVLPRPAMPGEGPAAVNMAPASSPPASVPASFLGTVTDDCRDSNVEFCKSIVNKKAEFCNDNVIVNKQKVTDICPLTCGTCARKTPLIVPAVIVQPSLLNFPINGIIPSNMDFDRKQILGVIESQQAQLQLQQLQQLEVQSAECKDSNPDFCRTVAQKRSEYCNENVIVGNKKVLDMCMLSCNACDRLTLVKKVAPGPAILPIALMDKAQGVIYEPAMLQSGQKTFCSDFNIQFCSYISNRREFCTEEAIVKGQKVLDIW
jgi:hypothetical protein